jgi:hypothetical protein
MSIVMPNAYAPDASTMAVGFGVGVPVAFPAVIGGGSDRGRESVAMMTPDETTATAIFAIARDGEGERECHQYA